MKTFDVFLKDRLTKMDVIIKTLTSNGVFSFQDKLFIDCVIKELEYILSLQGKTTATLNAKVKRLHTAVSEIVKSKMYLDVSANISASKMIDEEVSLLIRTSKPELVNKILYDFQNDMVFTTNIDSISYHRILPNANFSHVISTNTIDTFATKHIELTNKTQLSANVKLSGKSFTTLESIDLYLSSNPFQIYSSFLFDGETELKIKTSELAELEYRRVLPQPHSTMNIHIALGEDSINVLKMLSSKNEMHLLSSVILLLNQTVEGTISPMQLSAKASAVIRRQRLLGEMDNNSLGDLDNEALGEIDYVIFT